MKNLEELWGKIGSVTKNEVIIAAYHKKKDKSPLRKRYLKRKRRVRNPAQGK